MPKKKKPKSYSEKEVRAIVAELRSDLKSTVAKRDRWRQRAKKAEAAVTELRAQLKVAQKQLKRSSTAAPVVVSTRAAEPAASTPPATPPEPSIAATPATDLAPDASWTVAQLRAEARRRGLVGMTSKPKAELLAALA